MCPWGNLGLLRSHFEWKVTAHSSFKTTFSRLGARFSVEASFELQTDLFEVWLQKAFKVTFTRLRHRALNRHFRGMNVGFRASGGDHTPPARQVRSVGAPIVVKVGSKGANHRKGRFND